MIEVVAEPPRVQETLPAEDPISDDRRKQRHSRVTAERFLAAMDQVADSVFDFNKGVKGARIFRRQFGTIDVRLCAEFVSFLDKRTGLDFGGLWGKDLRVADLSTVNCSFVSPLKDDDSGESIERQWIIHKIRRATLFDLRNRCPLFVPGATWLTHEFTSTAFDKGYCSHNLYLTRDGSTWHACWRGNNGKSYLVPVKNAEDSEDRFWCEAKLLQHALWQRALEGCAWRIKMRRGPVELSIPTDDAGARELLILRDLAAGRQRRDAARHWVREHKRRLGHGRVALVRPHLRGKLDFTWGRWACSITEAEYDKEAYDQRFLPTFDIEERQQQRFGSGNA